jgi:hypothetical protein
MQRAGFGMGSGEAGGQKNLQALRTTDCLHDRDSGCRMNFKKTNTVPACHNKQAGKQIRHVFMLDLQLDYF